jgi:hypothetical protein
MMAMPAMQLKGRRRSHGLLSLIVAVRHRKSSAIHRPGNCVPAVSGFTLAQNTPKQCPFSQKGTSDEFLLLAAGHSEDTRAS